MTGDERMVQKNETASAGRILIATGVALVVAVMILFAAVLPAEYGLDPFGTGKTLGLLALAQVQPIEVEPGEYRLDSAELVVRPTEWVEYSYRLEEGGSMLFSWQATGELSYNFHSAPDGAPAGYAESFDAQESDQAHGTYTAPFPGIHGWYWENTGTDNVTISLTTAGFYSSAQEGRDRVSGYHELRDLRGNMVQETSPR